MTTQIFDDNCSLCRDCEKVLLTREELDTITDRLAREIEDTYRGQRQTAGAGHHSEGLHALRRRPDAQDPSAAAD